MLKKMLAIIKFKVNIEKKLSNSIEKKLIIRGYKDSQTQIIDFNKTIKVQFVFIGDTRCYALSFRAINS